MQAGVPLHEVQVMGGWTTYNIVLRNAHLEPERFAAHASVVDRKLNDTFLAQLGTWHSEEGLEVAWIKAFSVCRKSQGFCCKTTPHSCLIISIIKPSLMA